MERRTYLAAAGVSASLLAGCLDRTTLDSSRAGANVANADEAKSSSDVESGSEEGTAESTTGGNSPSAAADDFEDLSRWSAEGVELEGDSERFLIGSQSARVRTPEEKGTVKLSKSFETAIDLSDVVPGLACRSTAINAPWILLFDAEGNWIRYRRGVVPDIPLKRYNFGVDDRHGEFDPTAVTDVTIKLWTASGERVTFWFDDFHFVPRPDRGKVMIQFDDNNVTDYTEALPILEQYDYPAVTFVNPGRIEAETEGRSKSEGSDYVTVDEVHELHDAGWTIANHTYDHARLPELDREGQQAQIREGKQWLLDEGFEEGAQYFAYPFGEYNATTIELVDEYHRIGFAGGYPAQGYLTNYHQASRAAEPTAEVAKQYFEWTADLRGITSMMYHGLEGESLRDFETAIETLHEFESRGEIDVILPRDLDAHLTADSVVGT